MIPNLSEGRFLKKNSEPLSKNRVWKPIDEENISSVGMNLLVTYLLSDTYATDLHRNVCQSQKTGNWE